MRPSVALIALVVLVSTVSAQANTTTEGGNISTANINMSLPTLFWAGIVGWPNNTPADPDFYISDQPVAGSDIYTNEPNGSYALFHNYSMILTRLTTKPNVSEMLTPNAADFGEGGMFDNFTAFLGLNTSALLDGPLNTFCNPCSFMTFTFYNITISAPFVILKNNTPMGVLKFSNGTHIEPLFVGIIDSKLGFNGTFFDFEYMVPVFEDYYFYVYKEEECNITVWIDDVETTIFPRTAVPYKVEFLVTDVHSVPLQNVTLRVVENNGRNILYPILDIAKTFVGYAEMPTNSSGHTIFALEPSRYNIPDTFGYEAYAEVRQDSFYCRQNLSIADYSSLQPVYKTSLVNAAYGSQVKSSIQNMNSLSSTTTKWVTSVKMRLANINVSTNGSYSALPTLKAGAPNMLNITAFNGSNVINATMYIKESDGLIIFVPLQPDKELYNNTGTFYTNETTIIIPTRYNNNANLTVIMNYNGTDFATLVFTIDTLLEPPTAAEADMDITTYTLISSALQNINSVLVNIGKSISTV